jgi:hypothetical protein
MIISPPGPDSYCPIFFKNERATVRNSRFRLVKNCFDFPNPTSEVNQTLLTLIPKCHEPFLISQLRPVALCKVSYSLRSFLSVTFGKKICSYLTVTFKVQCNNNVVLPTLPLVIYCGERNI